MTIRHKAGTILGLVAAAVIVFVASGARAQSITEYVLSAGSSPNAITTGSDGALWFTNTNGIGRITTSGAPTEYHGYATPNPNSMFNYGRIAAAGDGTLWFTVNFVSQAPPTAFIGQITTAGVLSGPFPISSCSATPNSPCHANDITAGPDGALWFTELEANKIGRISTSGKVTEFSIPTRGSLPWGITAGPDGALWFTESNTSASNTPGNKIGRITTAGAITEFNIPTANSTPSSMTTGADGALWFTENNSLGNKIGRITTGGVITEFKIPRNFSEPHSITTGPDGALWFVEQNSLTIGRITTTGVISEFVDDLTGITAGPDGAMWFTEAECPKCSPAVPGRIGRITVPASTSPLLAAVLPSSRSVQVGNTATAFATIINASSATASSCAIVPVTTVPASFLYQTTNPATNALTGLPNTPVSIAGNGSQSFVIALKPNAPVVPTTVTLGFDCAGVDAAPSETGLNTLLYSASATPVPDVVALAATPQNDGILHITGTSGSNAFAVATVNVGAGGQITATANTGTAGIPLTIDLCETDPQSGQCISPIGPSVGFTINANATPTVAIFATAGGDVPFLPQTNRMFVDFSDANGVVRGSTSVAVETQ